MAKKKEDAATATAPAVPAEGSGITATAAPEGKSDAEKHEGLAAVMESALGREVLTPGESEAEPQPTPVSKPELGPHTSDGDAKDPDPEPGEQEPSPKAKEISKPPLNRHQVAMAKELGLSDQEITGLESLTPADLINALGKKFHAKASELGRLEKRLKNPDAQDPQADEADPDEAFGQEASDSDLSFEYADDDWQDESDMEKRNRHLTASRQNQEAITDLQAQLSEFVVERRREAADKFFEGLDSEVFADMGPGPFSGLAENSPQAAARIALLSEASDIQEYFKLQGKSLSLTESLDRALHFTHADKIAEAQRKKTGKQVTKSRRRATTRPTNQRSTPLPASDEASKHARIAAVGADAGVSLVPSK